MEENVTLRTCLGRNFAVKIAVQLSTGFVLRVMATGILFCFSVVRACSFSDVRQSRQCASHEPSAFLASPWHRCDHLWFELGKRQDGLCK